MTNIAKFDYLARNVWPVILRAQCSRVPRKFTEWPKIKQVKDVEAFDGAIRELNPWTCREGKCTAAKKCTHKVAVAGYYPFLGLCLSIVHLDWMRGEGDHCAYLRKHLLEGGFTEENLQEDFDKCLRDLFREAHEYAELSEEFLTQHRTALGLKNA